MTQNNIFASIILSIGVIVGGYLLGSQGFNITTAPAIRTLQTSADGKVQVVPDTIIISAGVELHGRPSQDAAYQDMNTSINAVKDILKNAGIEEKYIQTSGLYVGPEYHYDNGKQVREGYQANTSLSIRVEKKDIKVTNDILDAIAKVENITMNGVSYDLANKEQVYAEARKMALEKAREKADQMAQVAGVKIVGIESISESTNGTPIYQNARMMDYVSVATANEKSTDISPGQIDYTATVNVSFEIR